MGRVDAALDAIIPLLNDEGADADLEDRVDRILQRFTPLEARQLLEKFAQAIYDRRGAAWDELAEHIGFGAARH
jgi:hypothetical protein